MSDVPRGLATRAMQLRRRAVQRQLRLLFIYPCVYLVIWIMPSIVHFMNYTTYYAQHPVYALTIIQIFCLTFMTFVDVIIFCWRERPWRHIPGSDASFLGSFCFWRFMANPEWQVDRRESRAPSWAANSQNPHNKTSAPTRTKRPGSASASLSASGASGPSAPTSHAGLLASLKRWSLSQTSRNASSVRSSQPHSPVVTTAPHHQRSALPLSASSPVVVPSSHHQQHQHPQQPHRGPRTHGSDRRYLEAQRAYERLALERAEYMANKRRAVQTERKASAGSGSGAPPSGGARRGFGRRKEWFDRFVVDDDEGDEKVVDERPSVGASSGKGGGDEKSVRSASGISDGGGN